MTGPDAAAAAARAATGRLGPPVGRDAHMGDYQALRRAVAAGRP